MADIVSTGCRRSGGERIVLRDMNNELEDIVVKVTADSARMDLDYPNRFGVILLKNGEPIPPRAVTGPGTGEQNEAPATDDAPDDDTVTGNDAPDDDTVTGNDASDDVVIDGSTVEGTTTEQAAD